MKIKIDTLNDFDAPAFLQAVGGLDDEDIHLAHSAFAFAFLHQGCAVPERYLRHLDKLAEDVRDMHARLLKGGAADDVDAQLEAMRAVFCDMHDYRGDEARYDDLDNASLIRVIDRARGLPITLSILYIHAGRALGWQVDGLNIPGHFLCAVQKDGRRVIFDPFYECARVEAHDLRRLLKKALGDMAEISAEYYEPALNREILIRLQNNIKYRQIEAEDYAGALFTVQHMHMIDPQEYRLLLDLGVLAARVDQPLAALKSLEQYIEKAPHSRDREEAAALMEHIQMHIH